MTLISGLPKTGRPLDDLRAELAVTGTDKQKGHWTRAFRGPADVDALGREVYAMFQSDNGLMSLRAAWMGKVEDELMAMCAGLFNGPADATATLTSGGSESIYSALHAIREWGRVHRPEVTEPEFVAPYSLHPAFSKGCHYFGLKIVRTELGADLRASPENMERAITPNTIGMAGSAPCWPYALYDPIEELAAIAQRHNLWMHTDACVGGYLAPFAEKLGHKLPAWDFRVPGVMSISADLHKLGYCPKPASTIIWRSRDLLRYHDVHPSDWPGGTYAMRGFAGTRTAGPIFAAWAVMQYLGEEGYVRLADHLLKIRRYLIDGVNAIPGLKAWDTDLIPVAIEADGIDLSEIKAAMSDLGWFLVGTAEPPLINIPLDAATDESLIDLLLADLRTVAERAQAGALKAKESLNY
jgi:sphinganine-1-phosphate aldolase